MSFYQVVTMTHQQFAEENLVARGTPKKVLIRRLAETNDDQCVGYDGVE